MNSKSLVYLACHKEKDMAGIIFRYIFTKLDISQISEFQIKHLIH